MRKIRTRAFSILLTCAMLLSLLPVAAMASEEETTLPDPVNGVITLTKDVTMSSSLPISNSNLTIDLNGHTLKMAMLDVKSGASLTLTDTSTKRDGKLTTDGGNTVAVRSGGTLILEAGIIENTIEGGNAVFNMGTLTVKGGTVKGETGVYNTAWNGSTAVTGNIVCNIQGGTIDAEIWGVCVMGPGIQNGNLSIVDNSKLVVNISGGTIIAEQGIAGNASAGTRAGFTVNMTGGTIRDHAGEGTGMYLPSVGITNISGGSVSAAQAIRICAGELNITGGTITCTAVGNREDLIAGGSGGTNGAIVVGKASTGYVGDIVVNVSGNSVVQNTAESNNLDAVYPTIVVSDKNMALDTEQKFNDPATGAATEYSFKYSETYSSVTINAQVHGDIIKISNVSGDNTADGGNTKLEITSGNVNGNVINQTSAGDVTISGGVITGNVTNQSNGNMLVTNAIVTEAVNNSNNSGAVTIVGSSVGSIAGAVSVVDSSVGGGNPTTTEGLVAMVGAKTFNDLQSAINFAKSGNIIQMLDDIALADPLTIDKDITIDGQNQFTITGTIEVRNGTLKNMTLTNNPGQQILTIGSTEQNTIRMEGVTVKYPVTAVEGEDMKTLSHILNGNNANITITGCTFMNEANNGGVTEGAAQWSYGMYMNGQGANGSFTMTNSRFDGAFRTMLANINGTVTISENTFANSIYSNNSGSTSGSGEEATCITTADADVSGISIVNNTFDNAGAFYFQKSQGATVTGNVFKFDKFEHYIQLRGNAAYPLDLTDNTFEMGENDLVIVDVAAAPVKLPTGQKAVSYYAWADTAEAARPNDYSTYVYAYNADGSRTFYPESDAALNAFLNPTDGNVGVGSGDTVEIHQNLNLSDDATIPADAVLVIDSSATLTVPEGVTLTNNGTIVNPEQISGAVTSGETAAVKQTVKFQVTPSNAQVVVKDQSGAVVVPEENNLYYLADGSYTYTVSASGHYTQSSTFTVSGNAQAIAVNLRAIPTDSGGGSGSSTPTYQVSVDKAEGGKITVSPTRAEKGETVTITVKPDEGYELGKLTVTDKDGDKITLAQKDDNKYTFKMPAGKVTVKATFTEIEVEPEQPELPFSDVAEQDWFYDAVVYVYENELMNGTSATTFSPSVTTSRAMMLTMLARYDGVDTSTGSTWYEAGAAWAVAEGVSDGTNLEADLTREQLVTMLWRYAGSPMVEKDLPDYPDRDEVSDWAVRAMVWAVDNGIITGNGAGELNPQGSASRAEVATILMRFIQL